MLCRAIRAWNTLSYGSTTYSGTAILLVYATSRRAVLLKAIAHTN